MSCRRREEPRCMANRLPLAGRVRSSNRKKRRPDPFPSRTLFRPRTRPVAIASCNSLGKRRQHCGEWCDVVMSAPHSKASLALLVVTAETNEVDLLKVFSQQLGPVLYECERRCGSSRSAENYKAFA